MVILILIALCCFAYGGFKLGQAIYKLVQAFFYKKFANEKQIDEGFKKHVIKESDGYKQFEQQIDHRFKNGI